MKNEEPVEALVAEVQSCVRAVRDCKVILDADLAALYGVATKRFNEQVKRNRDRFPADFMFQLSEDEFADLRSQFATSNPSPMSRGGRRHVPFAFTEHGAIMAATILNSPQATEVSVYVVRTFVRMRELANTSKETAQRFAALAAKFELLSLTQATFAQDTQKQLRQLFNALRDLMSAPSAAEKRPIGFITTDTRKPKSAKG